MAQLKDLIVTGPSRFIGQAYGKITSADTVPVVNSNANLAFGTSSQIATIGGVAVTAKLPAGGYQGPQGPNGTNGKQGPQGPQGPKGATGNNGTNGTNGTHGKQGPQGPQGPKGATGNNGTNGTNGTHGKQGPQGPQGPKGATGNNGTNGTNGTHGKQGPQGPQGPKGAQGAAGTNGTNGTHGKQGPQGPQGPKGATGNNATGKQGPQGPQGPVGPQITAAASTDRHWLLGATAPGALSTSTVAIAGSTTGSGVYWYNYDIFATSDERLKDFDGDIKVDLDRLAKIPKKYFRWKSEGGQGNAHIGTSAQKLKELYPELVSGGGDQGEPYAVTYEKLSVVALAAIDKLHDENIKLKAEVEDLKARVLRLENKK